MQPSNNHQAEYLIEKRKQVGSSFLDPYHTHFLLIDDGESGNIGEINFRSRLEAEFIRMAQTAEGIELLLLNNTLIKMKRKVLVLILFYPFQFHLQFTQWLTENYLC